MAYGAFTSSRAGDRARTGDPQLGKLMLYQLSYARVVWQSTGRGGESKQARGLLRLEKSTGDRPLSGRSPALAPGPPEGAYMLTMYVYPSTCWSESNTVWKGVLASLRPVLTCTVWEPSAFPARS